MWGQLNNREELTFSSCTSLDDVEPWCYTRVQVSLDIIDSVFLVFLNIHLILRLESSLREHLPKKKCFLSGIARMRGRGGEALARIKKYNIYIYL